MTIPSDAPADFAELFRRERVRLLELLRSLTADDWTRTTPCPEWDVLGLVHHLVGGDLGVIARHRDGHHGTPAPEGLDESAFVGWLDDLQVDWVRAARRISPRTAIDLLVWLGPQVADTFDGQDAAARTTNVSWAGDAPVPVWLDQARELTECWIHRQQLHEAIDRPTDLDEEVAGPVLDALRWAYPYRLTAAGTRAERAEIEVTGPLERHWSLARTPAGWTFVDGSVTPPGALLSMTSEQAWRLLTNNYRTDIDGPLHTAGDPEVVDVLLRTRAVIGAPTTR